MLRTMRFLGVDLAWGEATASKSANDTGVAALDESCILIDAGWAAGLDETETWTPRPDRGISEALQGPPATSLLSDQVERSVG